MAKVLDHAMAIRRRAEEAQQFLGAVIAETYFSNKETPTEMELVYLKGSIEEARAIAYSALKEIEEIRSFLGMPEL